MNQWDLAQILAEGHAGLERLLAVADAHPDASLGDAYLQRRTTDLLAHLHAWHTLFEGWWEADRRGDDIAYPAEGYTWRDLDALNEALYTAQRGRDYAAVRAELVASHARVCALVADIPPSELSAPETRTWLGEEPLGAVAHGNLGEHYQWALEVLASAGLTDAA